MNPKIIKDASEIPEGAIRMHLYNPRNVLMPRGSMEKESIGPYLLDRLKSGFEEWTYSKYGDNPMVHDLIKCLHKNLMGEVEQAWLAFVDSILSGLSDREEMLLKISLMTATEPEIDSPEIKWFFDTIKEKPNLYVVALKFIDKFDRMSPEYAYFTKIHIYHFKHDVEYKKMFDEAGDPESTLGKLFSEADFWNDSKIIRE